MLLRDAARLLAFVVVVAGSPFAQADAADDFIIAVTNDRVGQVRDFLAKGIDPDTVGVDGVPALVLAARNGYAATVDALLAGKANVNVKAPSGDTAIMTAALAGHLDIVKKLRGAGAQIDGPGWTPLIYAATGGRNEVIEYLLAQGAKVNAASPNGTSALMMAVREGKGPTVTLLIARGADVNHRNENGASALAWAERGNESAMAAELRKAGAKQ